MRKTDVLTVVFDAVMISQAIWILITLHPGWLLIESEEQSVAVRPRYSSDEVTAYDPNSYSSYSLRQLKTESP